MDSISKLKSKFQSPSVRNKRGPSILDNLPSNRSTSSNQSLKKPKSNLFLPDVDDDDDVEEGEEDWIVGYQSTKKQKLNSNGSPAAPSRSNSHNSKAAAPFKPRTSSSNSDSFSSNVNKQSSKTTTALTPKQAPNPTSTSSNSMMASASGGSNSDKYYLCQYRKPQARKHKTWDGDAILIVTNNGATCSLKCADTARE